MLRAADVHCGCALRIGFSAVYIRPRSSVEHELDLAEIGRRQRDVPLCTSQAARTGKRLEQRRAELAAGAGYEDVSRSERIGDFVLHKWRTRSSSHGTPPSSGFAASYSSVTRYANRQSVRAS